MIQKCGILKQDRIQLYCFLMHAFFKFSDQNNVHGSPQIIVASV
jgi:hypothetical protein